MSLLEINQPQQHRGGNTNLVFSAFQRTDATVPESGGTVEVAIQSSATGQWWNDALNLFQAAKTQVALIEIDNVDLIGVHSLTFAQATMFPGGLGIFDGTELYVEYQVTAGGTGVITTPIASQVMLLEDAFFARTVVDSPISPKGNNLTVNDLLTALMAVTVRDQVLDPVAKTQSYYDRNGLAGGVVIFDADCKDATNNPNVREVMRRIVK